MNARSHSERSHGERSHGERSHGERSHGERRADAHPEDAFFRAHTLQLARHAAERGAQQARAAMVVKRGRVVGRAVQRGGRPEVVALEAARGAARGATLYVSHAPSAALIDAVQRAGIRRVVLSAGVPLSDGTAAELAPPATATAWAAAGIPLEWG